MKKLLWLDDYRDPLKDNWLVFSPIEQPFEVIWVKSYKEFVAYILKEGMPDAICFDHDLADEHYELRLDDYESSRMEYTEKSGHDCAKWLVDYCLDRNVKLPVWNIQSANPAGKDNIQGLLINFKKFQEKDT